MYDKILILREQHDRLLLQRLEKDEGMDQEWVESQLLDRDKKLKFLMDRFGSVNNLACTLKAQLKGILNVEAQLDTAQALARAMGRKPDKDDPGYYMLKNNKNGDVKMYIPMPSFVKNKDVQVKLISPISFQINVGGLLDGEEYTPGSTSPLFLVCSWAAFVEGKNSWMIGKDKGKRCLIVSFSVNLSSPAVGAWD